MEDAKGLVQAFVDGLQDRHADLRALAGQLGQLWSADSTTGEPAQVVELTYQVDGQPAQVAILDVQPSTPIDSVELLAWAEIEAGVEAGSGQTAVRTTSLLRTADTSLLDLLASTIGAKLTAPSDADEAARLESFRRILRGYFSRLKVKGTAASFEIAGRLQGFSDVRFVPLWSRVSPRQPNEVGAAANDSDFAASPEVPVTPGQPSELYDPDMLNDGEAYVWQSAEVGVDSNLDHFLPFAINGRNPFIAVQVTGTAVLPAAGTYILTGGAPLAKAKSNPALTAGFYFEAIAPGASFNGLKVEVSAGSTGTVTIRVAHSLSALKFRSSYFDLVACFDLPTYLVKHTVLARSCPDLLLDGRDLYLGNSAFAAGPGGVVGRAYEHARPWAGATPRVQATAGTETVDFDFILEEAKKLSAAIEEVRPMTRFARQVRCGVSFEHAVQYAKYTGQSVLLDNVSSTGAVSGVLDAEVERPSGLFVGSYTLVAGSANCQIVAEVDATDSNVVNLVATGAGLSLTGTVNYATGVYGITITANPGNLTLTGFWQPADTERIRLEASAVAPFRFQDRPEDSLETAFWRTLESQFPWRRGLVAGGERTSLTDPDAVDAVEEGEAAVLLTETQEPVELTVVDTGRLRPYAVAKAADKDGPPAVGFSGTPVSVSDYYTKSGSMSSVERETGSPSTSITLPFGTPYEIGLVRGHLVATPSAHWTPAQAESLALWLRLGDHPRQPYQVKDSSNFELTAAEVAAGQYGGSYLLSDRLSDTDFGWVLRLQAGRALTVSKDRQLALDATLAVWLKPASATGAEAVVLESGSFRLTLENGTSLRAKYKSNGAWTTLSGPTSIGTGFSFLAIASASIVPMALVEADTGSTTHVAVSTVGLGVVGGHQLLAGQQVLLTGQSSAVENGLWVAKVTAWVRATLPADFDPQVDGSYFKVKNGTSAGLWKLTSPASGAIVYGTTSLTFAKVNCRLKSYSGSLASAVSQLGSADVLLDSFSAGQVTALTGPTWETKWHDLRLWAKAKSAAELNVIRKPVVQALPLASRPTVVNAVSGDQYGFDVLPSGYAQISQQPRSSWNGALSRSVRYLGRGPKSGAAHRQLLGFGELRAPESASVLGSVICHALASGLSVSGTSTELESASPAHKFTHPVLDALYAKSDDDHLVELRPVLKPDGSVILEAQRLAQITELNLLIGLAADRPTAGPLLVHRFYYATDTAAASKCDGTAWVSTTLTKAEAEELANVQDLGGAETKVNTTSLIVSARTTVDGVLEAYTKALSSAAASPARYVYGHAARKLDLAFTAAGDFAKWDYDADGLEASSPIVTSIQLPARESAGLLTFKGGTTTLAAGRYRVTVDVSNWGALDAGFSGFALEASLGQNVAAEFKAMVVGQPTFSLSYGSQALCGSLPGNVDGTELQAAIGSSLLTLLSSGSYISKRGGPYYIRFVANGARALITAVTANCQFKATRLVQGTAGVQEIQKLELVRPTASAEITVTEPVVVEGDGYWRLRLYWRNDLPATGETLVRSVSGGLVIESTQRTILVHGARLELLKSQVIQVAVGTVGNPPSLSVVDLSSPSLTLPGGWQVAIGKDGARTVTAESVIYTSGATSPVTGGPALPAAGLLTGSSVHRHDSLILDGTAVVLGNELSTPTAPAGSLAMT